MDEPPRMEPQSAPSPSIVPRDLGRLLLGHYTEMLPPVALMLLALLLPNEIEWVALLPLSVLYGAAAARLLDVRRESLMELARQRWQAITLPLMGGLVILICVFITAFLIAQTIGIFIGDRRGGHLIAFAVTLGVSYLLLMRHWPRLGGVFVYDGVVDENKQWSPPAIEPLKELLQQPGMKAKFTAPVLKYYSMYVVTYAVVAYGAGGLGMLAWAMKIAFATALFPLFMLTLVQLTRDLAAVEGSWVEAAEVVETPAVLHHGAWAVADGGTEDKALGGDMPVDEELDDGSDRRVKVYEFQAPGRAKPAGAKAPESPAAAAANNAAAGEGASQYTVFGMQKGGPSPTPPGVAVPPPLASAPPPAPPGGPAIDFSPADKEPKRRVAPPPLPVSAPAPPPVPAAPAAAPPPANKGKFAKEIALSELEAVEGETEDSHKGDAADTSRRIATGVAAAGAAGAIAASDAGGVLGEILAAIARNDGEAVRHMVTHGSDPNALDAEGRPLLHRAATQGGRAGVEALLDAGANPGARDAAGRTALMAALAAGRDDAADLLLYRGADPRASDRDGRSTLMYALERSQAPAGAGGEPPKSLAEVLIVRRLLNAGADVKAARPDGETALHFAARRGDMDLVNALFFAGADVNAAMEDGTTPLKAAERAGQRMVANRLKMWGARE